MCKCAKAHKNINKKKFSLPMKTFNRPKWPSLLHKPCSASPPPPLLPIGRTNPGVSPPLPAKETLERWPLLPVIPTPVAAHPGNSLHVLITEAPRVLYVGGGGVVYCRVVWLLREKSCAKLFKGPQIQNYSLKCCFLAWRRASENVDSYPKMGQNIFGSVSGACAARGECLFDFL